MIDRKMTNFQNNIIKSANAFVYRNTGPFSGIEGTEVLGRLENRVVMASAIGITGAIDYLKLPLAAIEEIAKGTLLIPTVPFSKNLAHRCIKHFGHAFHFMELIPSKLILGTMFDVYALYQSLKSPQSIPVFYPPSYYGAAAFYNEDVQTEEVRNYPSLYKT